MNLYQSNKIVSPTPMTLGEYNLYRGWVIPENEDPSKEGYMVEYMDGGEPNHPKHKGYISWTPKPQFDNGYTAMPNESMTLGDVTPYAEQGMRLMREGWTGKEIYVVRMPGFPNGVPANEETARLHRVPVGTIVVVNPYWVIKTADGSISTWAPSGSDSLAKDWKLYVDDPELTVKDRVQAERDELGDKLYKLDSFLDTTDSKKLEESALRLLNQQAQAMRTYLLILDDRLDEL